MSAIQRRSKRIANHEAEIVVVGKKAVKEAVKEPAAKVVKPQKKKPVSNKPEIATTPKPKPVISAPPPQRSKMTQIKTVVTIDDEPVEVKSKSKTKTKTKTMAGTEAAAGPKTKSSEKKQLKSAVAVVNESKQLKAQDAKKSSVVVLDEELEIGDKFPAGIKVTNQDNKEIDLSAVIKDHHVVIIFAYPKASTPGCTRQVNGFKDNYEKLTGKSDVVVFGLSGDNFKAQKKFQEKQGLPYDLIADDDRQLIEMFGIGKQPKGVIRSHLIFQDGGLVEKRVKISPEVSFNEAVKFVESL